MAGFEVIVRPAIFPDIRPRPKPALAPQDDPEKGIAVINGNPASSVGLSNSTSVSTSYSRPTETERRVDEVRVYQVEDDGTVNKENFVDLQVANRIKYREGMLPEFGGPPIPDVPGEPPRPPEKSIRSQWTEEETVQYYKKVEEYENIKIRERDKIIKNTGDPG